MRGPRCCSGRSTSPPPGHRPTLHDEEPDYLRESIDFSVYFDERGAISKVEVFCEVTALQDGISRLDAMKERASAPVLRA
jgi:hypothetical protein